MVRFEVSTKVCVLSGVEGGGSVRQPIGRALHLLMLTSQVQSSQVSLTVTSRRGT